MVKKFFVLGMILSLILSVSSYGLTAADDRPVIELNGTKIEAAAYIEEGDIYIPLAAVTERLGYKIQWSGKDRTITLTKSGKSMVIDLNNHILNIYDDADPINGESSGSVIDSGAIIEGRTYMGVDFFSDNLGLDVLRDKQGGNVKLTSIKENNISIKTVKEASEDEKIKITLKYPQIDGLNDKAVQDGINAAFKKAATDARDEGLKFADELAKESVEYPGNPNKCETYFDYRVKYNQNGLLSVVFLNYQYTGGAHGLTVQSSRTFNLATGENYMLKDLFQGDTNYITPISKTVSQQIDEREKEQILPPEPLTPFKGIKADQDFYLSNHAVMIYFQQYEYFPYAAGIQEFPVDFSALKDIMKPDLSFLRNGSKLPEGSGNTHPISSAPFYGSKIAYVAEDGLYCTDLNGGKPTLLVKGAGISMPVFSNDGKAVAYAQEETLYSYDFDSAKTHQLLKEVDAYCPAPKGAFYASSQKNGIVEVNPQTTDIKAVIPAEKDTSYTYLKLSPDSKYLAYNRSVSGVENFEKGGVWLFDIASDKAQMIAGASKQDENSLGVYPSAGKWSPDSGKLFLWMMSQSASMSSDGVSAAVYDIAGKKLTLLDYDGLAYDENISFSSPAGFAMITGGGRMMFEWKTLNLFDLKTGSSAKAVKTPGIVPTTPCYSPDGSKLVFAASPAVKADDDYKAQSAAIAKRQLYLFSDGKLSSLTNDSTYRSETPLFLKDNRNILFARIKTDGEKSIWRMDRDGKQQMQLAAWKYSDSEDMRSLDYYGRIDWSTMFTVFDDTKAENKP